jgi:hypothetical protein
VLAVDSLLGMRFASGAVLLYILIYIFYAPAIFFAVFLMRLGFRK